MTGTELHWQLPLGLAWPYGAARSSHSILRALQAFAPFEAASYPEKRVRACVRISDHFRDCS